ncbi:MAG: hypothetical protein Q8Q26_00010 [Pseudorhodobacter sp.]|nr:hypothetical protein [Pseudorhodobacter sp.]
MAAKKIVRKAPREKPIKVLILYGGDKNRKKYNKTLQAQVRKFIEGAEVLCAKWCGLATGHSLLKMPGQLIASADPCGLYEKRLRKRMLSYTQPLYIGACLQLLLPFASIKWRLRWSGAPRRKERDGRRGKRPA